MSKKLTRELIVQKIRSDRLGSIKNLNLWGTNLDDVSLLQEMPSLEIISLSVNKIRTLKAFAGLPNLRELYLRNNMITDLNEIKYLMDCDNLKILWLSENPICDNPNYRNIVISALPQLVKLDDIMITEEERINAEKGISNALPQNKKNNDYDEPPDDYQNNNNNNKYNYNEENYNQRSNNINNSGNNNNRRSVQERNPYNNNNQYNNNNNNNNNNNKYNSQYDDDFDQRDFDDYITGKSKVRKAPTYQERERYENDMRRNDEDYRSNKRHSSKVMRDDYYSEDFNKNKTRDDNRDYGNYSNHNKGNSNVLNCVLMLLKELNKNELNVVKREIDKFNY